MGTLLGGSGGLSGLIIGIFGVIIWLIGVINLLTLQATLNHPGLQNGRMPGLFQHHSLETRGS